jgi:peptide/nickel transport system substrate-binding protein
MQRRHLLAASVIGLALPRLARAQEKAKVMRFVPHADLSVLDPALSSAYITRNHAYLVYDTLFGQDNGLTPQPQMVEGVETSTDGLRWTLTLRDGLRFHDNEPVLAVDCVASLRRWGRKDDLGRSLFAVTDDLAALDDRRIGFRLKQPFPLLPFALGKTPGLVCAMMPARIADGDPDKPITEVVGSGPFRFLANERVAGDHVAYERFAAYRPRPDGVPQGTAGPKIAWLDRVEWHILPDAATAAAALRTHEVDWWEQPSADMLPLLRGSAGLKVDALDATGYLGSLRINHLHGPTANPAIRRAMLLAIRQSDVTMAIAGSDPTLWRDKVGFFCPNTAMASDAGMPVGIGDTEAAKRALDAAGYKGETVLLMSPGDLQINATGSAVVADSLRRAGMTVDEAVMDWGTLLQRRAKREPVAQGGWSAYFVLNTGADLASPAVHPSLRGDGQSGLSGWCQSPALEALRADWFAAPDLPAQQEAARRLQVQAYQDLPYIPLGQTAQLTAYRGELSGLLKGVPVFWNIRRA